MAAIQSVRPRSLAARLGVKPGDVLLSLNGEAVRDEIDYRFQMAEERLEIVVARGDRLLAFRVEKGAGEDLGLTFTEGAFAGVRRCRNHCPFCFVNRLPPGLRRTLYVKDDDYRYSFLFGGFVTLTNLEEEDWARLARQRLSPLYVSVHATDLELRRRLLGNPEAPDILVQLRRLAAAHIAVHTQIVLCPGLNDGVQLERTLDDLASLSECVQTVAVVPVGLTRFGPRNGLRAFTTAEMAAVVRQVETWQRRLRRRLGRSFVHLADEFYLRSGAPLPGVSRYDGYPQYENGVGMARVLLAEWSQTRRRLRQGSGPGPRLTAVTGELAAPLLRPVIEELSSLTGATINLRVVRNHFFGPSITVAGLLTAEDVVAELAGEPLGDLLVLPRAMFDREGLHTLDDATVDVMQNALGVPVVVTKSIGELARIAARPLAAAS